MVHDSGGVTTNIVTVPLIAALGIGLASSIRGRNPLIDGFGLVALAVMVPMISVQVYGIIVFSGAEPDTTAEMVMSADTQVATGFLAVLMDLLEMFRDVLPIIITIVFFQYLILKRPLANPRRVLLGFLLVIFGYMPLLLV